MTDSLQLADQWTVIGPIGEPTKVSEVLEVERDGQRAVVKIVPKAPSGNRDLLADKLGDTRNVLRFDEIFDDGDRYLLRMPKADGSLYALRPMGPAPESEAVAVLRDIATALSDFGKVLVHRDIKPQNILRYRDTWHLADFGISRYIEEVTAQYTFAGWRSDEWTAPERFLGEKATISSDVYSLGVVGYWLVADRLPFERPDVAEKHLDTAPPPLPGVSPRLKALILEMLMKAPEARPTPAQILERLDAMNQASPSSPAIVKLHKLSEEYVERRSLADAAAAAEETRQRKRQRLAKSALAMVPGWFDPLARALDLPGILREDQGWGDMVFSFRSAKLRFEMPTEVPSRYSHVLPFDVVCSGAIAVEITTAHGNRWSGRSHSLWYCDAKVEGEYSWFETGFCTIGQVLTGIVPYALPPHQPEVPRALSPGMNPEQVAVPFTPLMGSAIDDFVEKWIGWFTAAVDDTLAMPQDLPGGSAERTWRQASEADAR